MNRKDGQERMHSDSNEATPLQHPCDGNQPLQTRDSSSEDEGRPSEKVEARASDGAQRHYLAIGLLLLYAFISIYSWALICILCKHPIGVPSWYDQAGKYGKSTYDKSDRVRKSSRIGLAVVAAIGIPVTSAISARAAAVYCQRTSETKAPTWSLRQMLALADRGWSGFEQIKDLLTPRIRIGTPMLIYCSSLVLLAFIIPILQGVLIGSTRARILTVENLGNDTSAVGNIITPVTLSKVPRDIVINNIISETQNGMISDREPNLWSSHPGGFNVSSLATSFPSNDSQGYQSMGQYLFTTALPVGTDTGMLRNLALRINMSISCSTAPSSDYPQQCPGHNPFVKNFTNIQNDSDGGNSEANSPFTNTSDPKYRGRICATGDIDASVWNTGTQRQDVSEDFWIDVQATNLKSTKDGRLYYTQAAQDMSNFTQHCTCNSTLGYFELPNYWNGHATGPLLSDIPADDNNHTYSNREGTVKTSSGMWGQAYDFNELNSREQPPSVPGPLLMSALAIFGNSTFFDAIASYGDSSKFDDFTLAYCRHLQKPFWGLAAGNDLATISPGQKEQFMKWSMNSNVPDCDERMADDSDFGNAWRGNVADLEMFEWLANFQYSDNVMAALTLTSYAVPKYMFTMSPNTSLGSIESTPGAEYTKPTMSLASMTVISALVALQLFGLLVLAIYAVLKPSWTETLDATAMLKLGFEISKQGSSTNLTASKAEIASLLDQTDGWVGSISVAEPDIHQSIQRQQIILGGPAPVNAKRR